MSTNMRLRPYDLDALTRAVCAHMVRNGIDVVMVDEGIIQTPDDSIIQIAQADVDRKIPPDALAAMLAACLAPRDGAGVRSH
jgi:hypothetical protein